MKKELENLIDEYMHVSHKDNALEIIACRYNVTNKEMWNFLLASRKFLDAGKNVNERLR